MFRLEIASFEVFLRAVVADTPVEYQASYLTGSEAKEGQASYAGVEVVKVFEGGRKRREKDVQICCVL